MQANHTNQRNNHLFGLSAVAAAVLLGAALVLGPTRASADEYIDSVESFKWILQGQGTTLGSPDGNYLQIGYVPEDDPFPFPSSITLVFQDNVAYDGPGPDLRVYTVDEAPFGMVHIEASYGGSDYISAGVFTDDRGHINLDLASLGLNAATHLRFTNASGPFGWYGFNLDAVGALHSFETPAITLTLDPSSDASPGFEEHIVLTTVHDGAPVAGIRVTSAIVSGPSVGLADVTTTYANGVAGFTWAGNGTEGIDTLETWLDLNADGVRDEGEPFGTATKLWRNGITGTIAISDLGGGTIEVVVNDLDLDLTDGADTVDIAVSSTTDPAGITLTLTETDLHSGILTATFTIAQNSNQSALTLAAIEGDTVTASYDDVIDANNQDPPPVTATLIVAPAAEAHISVCHLPPGNPGNQRTLTLGSSALEAHLAHGDIEGECAEAPVVGPPAGKPAHAGGPPEGKGKPPK
ncbi:MAG: hypothetical protein HOH95_03520 [Dehalococcoidia bacterium]|jgi:hypothetical protein|nr:hypothetical protein [Dehalococcoidia bacterium]